MIFASGVNVIANSSKESISEVIVFDESFDSWGSLDPNWVILNQTYDDFHNYFNISDGRLVASNNGVLAYENYHSYAYWVGDISYDSIAEISFEIYLPLDYDQKIGWAGQVMYFHIVDENNAGIGTRFVMDNPYDTSPIGWVWYDGTEYNQICTFDSGWHNISLIMNKAENTWIAVFDGINYAGLGFYNVGSGFDITKIQYTNALREEIQNIFIDNLNVTISNMTQETEQMTVIRQTPSGPKTNTVSMEFTPEHAGYWWAEIEDNGLSGVRIEIFDITDGSPILLLGERIGFSGDRYATKNSSKVDVIAGNTYLMTATPGGKSGAYANITGWFEKLPHQPPVAVIHYLQWYWDLGVSFDGSYSYDPDGMIISYYWDFSDGTTGTDSKIDHIFPVHGTYTVTLTVTDDGGLSDMDSAVVTVLW